MEIGINNHSLLLGAGVAGGTALAADAAVRAYDNSQKPGSGGNTGVTIALAGAGVIAAAAGGYGIYHGKQDAVGGGAKPHTVTDWFPKK